MNGAETMWKLLFTVIFLSVDAQRLKLNLGENVREGIEISDMSDVGAYQESSATYRLPNDTQPELYLINLKFGEFHEGDMSFTGNVMISIRVTENTNSITLHSSVVVVDTLLTTDANVRIDHQPAEFDLLREFMTIKTNTNLIKGQLVRLTINFRGTIGTAISGVYRGSYLDDTNERRYFLATHMQTTFFRRVCPGYDEPQFKAFFSIVLSHNSLFKASISNMPMDHSEIE